MSRWSRYVMFLMLCAVGLPSWAQVTSPNPPGPGGQYDGSCQINGTYALASYAGGGVYNDNGSLSLSCRGAFYGKITATVYLDDPNHIVCSVNGDCAPATFAYTAREWPIVGLQCVGYGGCITTVKEVSPVSANVSLSTPGPSKFTTRAVVEWVTGPCTAVAGSRQPLCPTQRVTASMTSPKVFGTENY
jgi:hypothetical protein